MRNHLFGCLLLGAFVCCVSTTTAQTNFSKVDAHARQVAFPAEQNVALLAADLTAGLTTETEKARTIFVWITANIRYDAKLIMADDVEVEEVKSKQRPAEVLRSKRAICEGYANLYTEICQAAGLKSLVATGLTKTPSGRIPRIGHAWNLVRTEGEWKLIDATWGAGSLDDDKKYVAAFDDTYFFSEPQTFGQNHFPTDPLFQLLEKPMDLATFRANNSGRVTALAAAGGLTILQVKDSLNLFVGLDSAAARLNGALRTLRFDPTNGQANFSLALHQFNASNQLFYDYQSVQQQLMQKRTPLTLEQLKQDGVQLLRIQQLLDACKQTIAHIPPGDRHYRTGQSLQRTADSNKRSCQEALKFNQDMQGRLKGKG